jgi:hypothetical protein
MERLRRTTIPITTESMVTSSRYLFFASLIAFVIFLIMFFIHYFFVPFLPSIFPSKLIVSNTNTNTTVIYDTISLYTKTVAPKNTKMDFTSNIKNISTDNFTLSFDCFLNGTYRSTDVPRVLFYFGGAAAINNINNSNFKEYKGTSEGETPKLLVVSNSDLLDKVGDSNFVIYVDPVKNDMKIGIYTIDIAVPPVRRLEIASIIKNVPINKVFKVTMVLTRNFVEVYMNKKLVNTYKVGSLSPMKATLSSVGVDYGIYTPIDFIGNTVQIANVQFYNGPLTSIQIRNLIPDLVKDNIFNS